MLSHTDNDSASLPIPPDDRTWLSTHSHEPNLAVPPGDGTFVLLAGGREIRVTVSDLHSMPHVDIGDCYIVSTGHGSSGPFRFTGARLADLLRLARDPVGDSFQVDVISADGFGCRLRAAEFAADARPPLLAWSIDSTPMRRAQGLVRLIVPSETQDALRQVKWIARIEQVPR